MWIFIGPNVEARASQAGLHKPIKRTASAKEGKVSSLCRGAVSYTHLTLPTKRIV